MESLPFAEIIPYMKTSRVIKVLKLTIDCQMFVVMDLAKSFVMNKKNVSILKQLNYFYRKSLKAIFTTNVTTINSIGPSVATVKNIELTEPRCNPNNTKTFSFFPD